MIKTVIFDLDDTIIDTEEHIRPGLAHVFSQFKKFFPDYSLNELLELNKEVFGELILDQKIMLGQAGVLVWMRMFITLGLEPTTCKVVALYQAFQEYILEHVSLQPGFLELVIWLERKRIKIAVLSDGAFNERAAKIKQVGLHERIAVMVSTDLVGWEKPHPEPFRYLLELMRLKPEEAIYVGDSPSDVAGAVEVGIETVIFDPKGVGGSETGDKSSHRIKDHQELIPIIIERNTS